MNRALSSPNRFGNQKEDIARFYSQKQPEKTFRSYYCDSNIFYLNLILENTLAPDFYLKKWFVIFYLIGFEYIYIYYITYIIYILSVFPAWQPVEAMASKGVLGP